MFYCAVCREEVKSEQTIKKGMNVTVITPCRKCLSYSYNEGYKDGEDNASS